MTDREQNIAIAGACGWVNLRDDWRRAAGLTNDSNRTTIVGIAPINVNQGLTSKGCEWVVPSYTTDLNAMHEAEKILMADDAMYSQRNFYAHNLGLITLNDNGRGWQPLSNDDCFPILNATAAQRAKAFLQTLDLWKD